MLKKILILALTLNTPYILPFHASSDPRYDLAVSGALSVSGIICAWLAYKDFKKGWQTLKEINHQIKILNEMGAKVYEVSESKFVFDSFMIKEHYTMKIPSNFSQQQEKKAKEHWSLLLANEKHAYSMVGPLAALGSLILISEGIVGIIKCINV